VGVRRSNAPEDHSSKSVKPTSRKRYGNTERSPGNSGKAERLDGEHPSWMKVQSDSHERCGDARSGSLKRNAQRKNARSTRSGSCVTRDYCRRVSVLGIFPEIVRGARKYSLRLTT
jgi:hypothetical protein